jgi:hypothetical protein
MFEINKIVDGSHYSFMALKDVNSGYALVKFKIDKKCDKLTTFGVYQKDYRSEKRDGNHHFDMNQYS